MGLVAGTFLGDFVLPLVTGGQIHVGRPLDAGDLQAIETEMITETDESLAIRRARQSMAARIWLHPLDMPLDPTAVRLCACLHNLLFMSHPEAASWRVSTRSLEELERFAAGCLDGLERPDRCTDAELVARHTLVHNMFGLTRTDVHLTFWAGRRSFLGTRPPANLKRWPRLRRVHEETRQVRWLGSGLSAMQLRLLRELMGHSPLSDLLHPHREQPPFDWLPAYTCLYRPAICRTVCHRYLELGLEQVGPALARAFWQLADASPRPTGQRQALELVAHLVSFLFATRALRDDSLDDPAGDLVSVLAAAARCELLPTVDQLGDRRVHERLTAWVKEADRQLAGAAVELRARLQRGLAA